MDEDRIFVLAERTFAGVVGQIRPDQLDEPVPEWFEVGRSEGRPTLRELLDYHAYDTAWIPDTFAGRTINEVGDAHDGDLLDDDPLGSYQRCSDAAVAAIETSYDPDRIVHFSYGDLPAHEAITHVTSFRVFRAYDVAKLIGVDRALPAELVAGAQAEIEPRVDEWRQMGIFKPALPVDDDADPQAKLFALVGRDPHW